MQIKELRETQFDLSSFQLATHSKVKNMDRDLVQNRVNLLFNFSKSVDDLLPSTYFEESMSKNSIANKIKENQTLLIPSVKMRFFKTQLQAYWNVRATSISVPFRYNKKEAEDFSKLGKENNPDFIHASVFGQLYQKCLITDAEFAMMTNTDHAFTFANEFGNSEKCPAGHPLQFTKVNPYSVRCDRCSTSVPSSEVEEHGFIRCPECKYDVCRKCVDPKDNYCLL